MSALSTLLQRFWPVWVCAAVGLAAYFQARGFSDLLAGALHAPAPAPPPVPAPPRATAPPDGDAILARNPFDSSGPPLEAPPVASVSVPTNAGAMPKCQFGAVTLTLVHEDPGASLAAVHGSNGKSELVSIGDTFGEHTLRRIGWNRVWFRKGGDRCRMELGDNDHMRKKRPARPARPKPPPRRRSRGVPKHILDGIERVGPNELRIDRRVLDEVLQNQALLTQRARVRPYRRGDELVGLQLMRVRPDSLLHHLGLENGDVLKSINGYELTRPEKALEAYGRLRSADRLSLEIERKGKRNSIDVTIQ